MFNTEGITRGLLRLAMAVSGALILFFVGYQTGQGSNGSDSGAHYQCDGSDVMGYAVPGTDDAAGCWVEFDGGTRQGDVIQFNAPDNFKGHVNDGMTCYLELSPAAHEWVCYDQNGERS